MPIIKIKDEFKKMTQQAMTDAQTAEDKVTHLEEEL